MVMNCRAVVMNCRAVVKIRRAVVTRCLILKQQGACYEVTES